MKRRITDFNTPHIIGDADRRENGNGRERSKFIGAGKRLSSKRIVAIITVLAVLGASVTAWLFLYQPFSFKLKKTDYHMLVLGREHTLAAAQALQSQISDGGGSGYIINTGEFFITAFVYINKSDADSVLQRLKQSYAAAAVINYQIPVTKIKRFGDRAAEKQLKSLLNYPLELIDTVIKYVYLLDSFESTESEIMLKLQSINTDTIAKKEALELYKLSADELKKANEPKQILAATVNFSWLYYSEICLSLQNIALVAGHNGKLTHHLKSFACEAVYKYYVLRHRLNGL